MPKAEKNLYPNGYASLHLHLRVFNKELVHTHLCHMLSRKLFPVKKLTRRWLFTSLSLNPTPPPAPHNPDKLYFPTTAKKS
jgi:hypothetical protein